jgi:hypothetical protein
MELIHAPTRSVFVVDLHLLSGRAFSTLLSAGKTLKDILESKEIGKGPV